MAEELVTIIVPVYNVEKYLDRCINSLLDQTYEELEILLIDDGSNDSCHEICDNFSKRNKKIHVIHKKNGGLASARNTGIEQAKGKYITFVDGDDYVTPFYVENLVNAITKHKSDLAVSMFVNVVDGDEDKKDKGSNQLINYRTTNSERCLADMLYQRGIETSAPGKLYLRSQIEDLRFPDGKLYEDIMYTTTMISRAKRIAIIDNVDYLYYQRSGSIQYQSFNKRKMDCIWHSRLMIDFIYEKYQNLQNAAYIRYFGALCNIYFQIPKEGFEEEKELIWNDIKKYRQNVLKDINSRKKSKIAALLSYLGPTIMRFVYSKTQIRGQVKDINILL